MSIASSGTHIGSERLCNRVNHRRVSASTKCAKNSTTSSSESLKHFKDIPTSALRYSLLTSSSRLALLSVALSDSSSSSSSDRTRRETLERVLQSNVKVPLLYRSSGKRREVRKEGRRLSFQEVTAWMSDEEFQRAFRMQRSTFRKLVELLCVHLERNEAMALRVSDGPIPVQVRVGIALRLMAGGSAIDLMTLFHIPDATINYILREVSQALNSVLTLPGVPTSVPECRRLAEWMRCSRVVRNPFYGCIGAVDGMAIRIHKPREKDLPRDYRSRKGFFALPLQCLVDGKYRILCFSMRCVGATHDSMSYAVSNLAAFLRDGCLPREFWIVGDEAYVCSELLITPYARAVAPPGSARDALNFFLSSMRIHVEQAFGILVSKWAILQTSLNYSLRTTSSLIKSVILLHNFCIETSEPYFQPQRSQSGAAEEDATWRACVRISTDVFDEVEERLVGTLPLLLGDGERCVRRRKMVDIVQQQGLRRPAVRCA